VKVAAVVDGQVAGGEDAAAGGRGEERLEAPAVPRGEAFGGQADRVAELGEPVERGEVVVVVGDRDGALGPQPGPVAGGRLELGVERRKAADRVQVQGEQVLLAEDRLGDRAEHPRRDQARLVVGARVDEGHGPARAGRPPGDRGADHAAADDDDVGFGAGLAGRGFGWCGHGVALPSPALPGSGSTVGGGSPPSQPR